MVFLEGEWSRLLQVEASIKLYIDIQTTRMSAPFNNAPQFFS